MASDKTENSAAKMQRLLDNQSRTIDSRKFDRSLEKHYYLLDAALRKQQTACNNPVSLADLVAKDLKRGLTQDEHDLVQIKVAELSRKSSELRSRAQVSQPEEESSTSHSPSEDSFISRIG